jgi:hypothetical protein
MCKEADEKSTKNTVFPKSPIQEHENFYRRDGEKITSGRRFIVACVSYVDSITNLPHHTKMLYMEKIPPIPRKPIRFPWAPTIDYTGDFLRLSWSAVFVSV